MTQTLAAPAPSLPFFGLVHIPLERAGRRRCVVAGRGHGVVTARTQMGDHVTSYDVELDSGRSLRVAPGNLRLVDAAR